MSDPSVYDDNGRIDHAKLENLLESVVSDTIDSRLGDIHKDITEIKTALTGNGLGASEGLITRVKETESKVEGLEGRLDRLKWSAGGAAFGAGLGGGGLVALITSILKG